MQYENLSAKADTFKQTLKNFTGETYNKIQQLQYPGRIINLIVLFLRRIPGKIKYTGIGSKTRQAVNAIFWKSGSAGNGDPAQRITAHTDADRIRSVDILRGLVILVMIFVNDAYSIPGAPKIFLHMRPGQDGMTIADWVFPAFLFIVGMSMPFSLGKRIANGESMLRIWEHIIKRTAALLFIGFFMVNMGSIDRTGGIIEYRHWIFFMLTGVILFRISFSRSLPWVDKAQKITRTAGFLLLIFLSFAYTGRGGSGLMQMRSQWWGIVGLIGWAYFISSAVYVYLHKLPAGMLGASALLFLAYFADKAGMFSGLSFLNSIVSIGPFLGTHSAICLCGASLGMLISKDLHKKTHKCRITRALGLGAAFAFAAFMLHSLGGIDPMFRISKLAATPQWGLLSAAFTSWAWALVYLVSDVSKENKISRIIEHAGRNALMAYILSELVIYMFYILEIHYFKNSFYGNWAASLGLWRAIFLASSVALFTGLLEKFKIRLRL